MYKGSKSQVSGANKFTKNGLNGVPVARLGLILGEDGATASRKLSKPSRPCFHLPGAQKYLQKSQSKNWGSNELIKLINLRELV